MPTQIELVRELSEGNVDWHDKYPWFSLGHLMNASNTIQTDDFKTASQAAAIFFNDVQRMHWLLHEPSFNKNKILSELNVPISADGMQTTPQPFPKREHFQTVTLPSHLIAVAAIDKADEITEILPVQVENTIVDDVVLHQNIDEKILFEEPIQDLTIGEKDELQAKKEIHVQQTAEPITTEQNLPQIENETTNIQTPIQKPETVEDKKTVTDIENIVVKEEHILIADGEESISKAEENIKSALHGNDAMELTFEPYHTIDYFASQGIKVDAKAEDRLGKQVKSFTSWLKSMKRLTANDETPTEVAIVQMNDRSLENANVLTEAMAAVLLKQGKKAQAIEIFRQLSLQHPEKSHYFAAQIEQIKN